MKKLTLILAVVLAAFVTSCTAQGQKASLKSEIDTLSYSIGMSRVDGLDQYLLSNGVDSTMMVDFLKGFDEGSKNFSKKDKAYALGVQVGQMVSKDWIDRLNEQLFGSSDSISSINRELMIKGFVDAIVKKTDVMTLTNAQTISNMKMESLKSKLLEEKYGENKAAGEKFLAENKTKEGVMTTASGLQYKVIKEGNGEKPAASSNVTVNYKGTLIDGTEFDNSYSRNEPATFAVNGVISGWQEALQLMSVGSKYEIYIPQELGYGSRDTGGAIPPFSALIFEVELLSINK